MNSIKVFFELIKSHKEARLGQIRTSRGLIDTPAFMPVGTQGTVKSIIVDDIIDSGGTIINAVEALKKNGATDVYVFITHAVLSGDASNKIKKSKIKNLVLTDTINNLEKVKKVRNIEVLSMSNLLAEAMKRISNSTSVSDLFK